MQQLLTTIEIPHSQKAYNCTCSNCTGTGTGSSKGYGFYNCSYCSSCRAGKKASTTATWGGTNTYIDSDSCDYVAS